MNSDRNIIITGFMGTGKTAVGREVARMLNRTFHDTDLMIQSRTGMSIADIFDRLGEAHFRRLENEVVHEMHALQNAVIATGGGTLLSDENLRLMSRSGIIFCLSARIEVLKERLMESDERPLLQNSGLGKDILTLLKKREEAYRRLPNHLDTSELSPQKAASRVINLYGSLLLSIRG